MDVRARFERLRDGLLPAVLDEIRSVTEASSPPGSPLPALCAYQMDTGGKRLRATLPLLVAEVLGAPTRPLVPFAAACELLHNATLVHDDLQDGDEVRRRRPSVWARYGFPTAVDLGDAMLLWPILLLQRLERPPAERERAVARLVREALRVVDGQEREFAMKAEPSPGLAAYFATVEGKTSGLFALPLAGAAALCAAPAETVDGLEEAARHLGVLFQIQDDVLDLYGEKGRGARGGDVREGKRSALVVHALDAAAPEEAAWLRQVLDRPREATADEDVVRVTELLVRTGSLAFAREEIRRRREAALAVPAVAARPPLAGLLAGLCDLLLAPIAGI